MWHHLVLVTCWLNLGWIVQQKLIHCHKLKSGQNFCWVMIICGLVLQSLKDTIHQWLNNGRTWAKQWKSGGFNLRSMTGLPINLCYMGVSEDVAAIANKQGNILSLYIQYVYIYSNYIQYRLGIHLRYFIEYISNNNVMFGCVSK